MSRLDEYRLPARAALAGRLRERRVEIDEAIFACVRDQRGVGFGVAEDSAYVAGVRAAIAAVVDYALVGIERGRDRSASVGVPRAAVAQARRAARLGVGLDIVLRRYVAGYTQLGLFLIEEAAADGRPGDDSPGERAAQRETLGEAFATVAVLAQRLIAEVSGAYRQCVAGQRKQQSGGIGERTASQRSGSSGGGPRDARIERALVEVLDERGLASASVGLVLARAGVSRRTFYQLFPGGLEDCLLDLLERTGRRVGELAARRIERAGSWQEGVREALAALLVFFDSEPALTRVCFVEALGGGRRVVQCREAAVAAFRELMVGYVERGAAQDVPPLVAEGVVASVMGIVYERVLARGQGPLIELLGPLMGVVMAPFAAGEQMLAEEARRGQRLAHTIQVGEDPAWRTPPTTVAHAAPGSPSGLPRSVANPGARRARECLLYVAEQVRSGQHPSNRAVAAGIGVRNKGQISRLLSRLCADGLLERSGSVGGPNAWFLTDSGATVAQALGVPNRRF